MTKILTLPAGAAVDTAPDAAAVLEAGGLVLLPDLAFAVEPGERDLLDPAVLGGRSKNVSLSADGSRLSGSGLEGARLEALTALTARYAVFAEHLLDRLVPAYTPHLRRRRTSFRPGAVAERALSPRKDDRRLHVDAFPSTPVGGDRILRVFSNVDPQGRGRVWNVGSDLFEDFARAFQPRISRGGAGLRRLMAAAGVTRGLRTGYDQAMLDLHDAAKLDAAWQAAAPFERVEFPAGSTWIVYTDGVLHAALAGQHAFEQTFMLPVRGMVDPERSPLRVLERLTGRVLA